MLKRSYAILAAWLLAFCLASPARAQSISLRPGVVNDDAAVLTDATARDLELLNGRSPVEFTVVTRHFLGGAEVQEYADQLFSGMGLNEDDGLLLLVIGEERYAVTLGAEAAAALSGEQLNSLLSARLRKPFLELRDYDAAVGDFLLAAASQIARAEGVSLNTSGLFGTVQSAESTLAQSGNAASENNGWYNFNFNNWTGSWWNGFFAEEEGDDLGFDGNMPSFSYSSDSGFSTGRLILIVIVLLVVLRSRKKKKRVISEYSSVFTDGVSPKGHAGASKRVPPRATRK